MRLMTLLGFAGRSQPAETPVGRDRAPMKLQRALQATRYDAAQPGGPNEKHWSSAWSMSARQANSPEVRRVLRDRARYEVANNSLARGMIDTLADDTIGEGPNLMALNIASRDEAQQLEWAWYDWAEEIDLWGKMRLARKARAVDGEVFLVLVTNQDLRGPVKLDVVLVETERVAEPGKVDLELSYVDGIEFNANNNPVRYRVLRNHPDDDILARISEEADWIPARDVLHYFRTDRPGQVRGIPEITPALGLFGQLRRFVNAVIGAAEAAANNAQVIYTDNPVDTEGGFDPEPMEEIELHANTATVLPDGWKLGQVKAEQPITTFGDFRRQIANEIGRCLSMPINVILADSSQHNFASGKLDHVIYGRKLKVDREELRIRVLDPIFRRWLAEAQLVSGLLPQAARRRQPPIRVTWTWPAWEHADPAKEGAGVKARMEAGVSNLIIECGRQGLDWQEVLEGEKAVQEYRDQLGIKAPAAPGPAAPGKQPAPAPSAADPDEEDDDTREEADDDAA